MEDRVRTGGRIKMALRVKDLLRAGKRAGSSRRRFMGLTGVAGAAMFSALDLPLAYGDTGPLDANQRRQRAFAIRRDAAILQRDRDAQTSIDNGDEQLYPSRIASFTK